MISVTPYCPEALRREQWHVDQLELRKRVYEGQNSLVYHAIDRRSGISIALKLYRRERLTDIERYQVGCWGRNGARGPGGAAVAGNL
jgi:aurora kinase